MSQFLILYLLLLTASSTCAVEKFLVFGDKCTPGLTKCNPAHNLVCLGRACRCPYGTAYDKDRGMCLLGYGSPCNIPSSSEKSPCITSTTCNKPRDLIARVVPQSVTNEYYKLIPSANRKEAFCICNKGFQVVRNGRTIGCQPILGFGANCSVSAGSSTPGCDPDAWLTCSSSKTCVCEKSKMYFSKTLNRCASPFGTECSILGGRTHDHVVNSCDTNAVCSASVALIKKIVYSQFGQTPVKGQESNEGHCVCAPGFTRNTNGNCTANYQVACSATSVCNTDKFLACVDGICQCEKPSSQVFLTTDGGACTILVGYPCNEKSGPKCIPNSVCVKGQCVCRDGYTVGSDNRCLLAYGSKCSVPGDVNSTACNHFQGLACIESKCTCFDSLLKWDAKAQICTAGEGKSCGQISPGLLSNLEVGPMYPLGISSTISYFLGCEAGLTCARDTIERNWQYCQKLK